MSLGEAMRSGSIQLDGPPALCWALLDWWAWSPTAEAVRAAMRPAPG